MRLLLAAALLASAVAHADTVTCERTTTSDGFTLSCKAAAAPVPVTPVPVVPTPVDPTPPVPPVVAPSGRTPAPSGPISRDPGTTPSGSFDLSPGHPKVNQLSAGGVYAFSFQSTGASTTVGYGTASGTDSGMRVTSWITDSAGRVVLAQETRVVANWQPFVVQLPAGTYHLFVQPAGTGPLMVEQQ